MIDPPIYRSILGRFATGVTVLTARDSSGRDHGMTVSAFCSVSLEPTRVLCCVERIAVMHDVIAVAPQFVVNILSSDQESISRRFAEDADDRFDGLGYTRGITGTAILDGILAYVECDVVDRFNGGDHTIVLGEVIAGGAHDGRPLLYYRGGYAQLER
ncbi:MAG TPA: flavin reductase family protein [Gemmatimonadaceae bacterium]|jgi:flavin reductase (DIM6/NTAB) family NADH-FMN oxidoreductase RutF